MSISKIQL